MCVQSYHLDPIKFISSLGLSWQAALNKTEVKLELLINIDMLLIVENWIRGRKCNAIHWHSKANNKYIKDYDKNKEGPYLKFCDVNGLYDWELSQKLPVNKFKGIEDTQFN